MTTTPFATSVTRSACRPRASSAWPRSTTSSRSSRRASTRASCARAPPATSTGRAVLAAVLERLGTVPGDDGGRQVSLLTARCLGACSLAPAAIVDGEVEGRVRRPRGWSADWRRCDDTPRTTPAAAARARARPAVPPDPPTWLDGRARGRCERRARLRAVSCLSARLAGRPRPLGEQVTAAGLERRRREAGRLPGPLRRRPARPDPESGHVLRARDADTVGADRRRPRRGAGPAHERPPRRPFFDRQVRIVTENSGCVDSERVEEYVADGGYQALPRCSPR